MPGTQCKLYRGGIEKTGKGRRIKEGRIGEGDILCSLEMMRRNFSYSWNKEHWSQNVIVEAREWGYIDFSPQGMDEVFGGEKLIHAVV